MFSFAFAMSFGLLTVYFVSCQLHVTTFLMNFMTRIMIVTLFVPLATGINSLQLTYLIA